MDQILTSLRALLISHLADSQPLAVDAPVGSTVITVNNASRFKNDDEIFLQSGVVGLAEKAQIKEVAPNFYDQWGNLVDPTAWNKIELTAPTTRAWNTADSAYVLKAIGWMPLKRIHIGDLKPIPSFPTITLVAGSEDNDWMTIRSTEHEHKISIRTYVLADNFEATEIAHIRYSKQIREILMDHIHPIINGVYMPLTADLPAGSTVVSVASTAGLRPMNAIFLRDAVPHPSSIPNPPLPAGGQEAIIRTILSPTQFELSTTTDFDYLVARQAEAILIQRYMFDSRPSSIKYGFVPGEGGSLLKASEISYFAKEQIVRNGNLPS